MIVPVEETVTTHQNPHADGEVSSQIVLLLQDLWDVLQVSSIHQSVNSWQNCGETQDSDFLASSRFPLCVWFWLLDYTQWGFCADFPLARRRQNNTPVSKQSQTSAAGERSAYSCSALVCSCLLIPTVSPSHLLSLTRSLSFILLLVSLSLLSVSLSRWLRVWGGNAGLANRLAANWWRTTAGIFGAESFFKGSAPANIAFRDFSSNLRKTSIETSGSVHGDNCTMLVK